MGGEGESKRVENELRVKPTKPTKKKRNKMKSRKTGDTGKNENFGEGRESAVKCIL